jgi:hypothetical protein
LRQGHQQIEGLFFYIESSVPFSDLPVEFRAFVKQSDIAEVKALENVVIGWADKNGYKRC